MLLIVSLMTSSDSSTSAEIGMLSPEYLEPHLQSGHLLHGVVVDVVGDPGALFLGGSHDVLQEPRRCSSISSRFAMTSRSSSVRSATLASSSSLCARSCCSRPWMVRSCDSRSSVSHALCSARAACSANCSTIAITHRRMVGWPLPRSTTTAPSPCRRSRSNGTTRTLLASGRSDASRGSVSGSIARKSWLARSSQARDTDRSIADRDVGRRLVPGPCEELEVVVAGTRGPLLARIRTSNPALRGARWGCPRLPGRCPPEPPSRRAARGRASVYGVGARSRPRTARCPRANTHSPAMVSVAPSCDVRLDAPRHPTVQDTGSSGLR